VARNSVTRGEVAVAAGEGEEFRSSLSSHFSRTLQAYLLRSVIFRVVVL
jgi:hypothetical protein